MALAPKFRGQRSSSLASNVHTIELYLDYVCPFSSKMFKTVYESVFPLVHKKYAGKVEFIFRQQIQPWHPSSILTHEAAIAVLKVAPEKFWLYSSILMSRQKEYFDVNVVNESRNDTYKRLAALAKTEVKCDAASIYSLLEVKDKPSPDGSLNIGNGVTDDIKVLVKAARLVGVHVSPTVIFNGNIENSISSGMTGDEWAAWLEKNIV